MMGCSLTDEEKQKLDELLKETDDNEDGGDKSDLPKNEFNCQPNADFKETSDEESDLEESGNNLNGFTINDLDQKRLEEINLALEQFDTNNDSEVGTKCSVITNNDQYWTKYLSQQALKDIDSKLQSLYKDKDNIVKDNNSEESDNDSVD